MRNSVIFLIAINVLLYVSVILDIPILRQFVGFVFLTFLPGFVILQALGIKTRSVAVDFSISVSVSVAFVMFIGLLANSFYPLLGISAPLSTLPFLVTTSALTLTILIFGQIREIGTRSNAYSQLFYVEIDTKGVILCVVSFSVLSLSIFGALYHNVFLLVSAIAGTAAIFATSIFLYKRILSCYYTLALFVISLSLLLQIPLSSNHVMGYDIFSEYYVYKSVYVAGHWTSPGTVLSYDIIANLNSTLSVTILPTVYSTILNLNGELIFKMVFPFIFCFVPIFLLKIYETQFRRPVALFSVFFFIAEPMNWMGLESSSLAREMIAYLFLSAMVFCFVKQDMDLGKRRFLVIMFSAGLAVSHYSLAFLSVLLIVFVFAAFRIAGKKDALINSTLVLCTASIIFAWYMYVATPPLNNLRDAIYNVASRLTTDLFDPQKRLSPGMERLSPMVSSMSLNNLIHKVVIYISEFFVAVGTIILVFKPKEFKFYPSFRWMAIFAAFLLLICIVVPNVSLALNFSRFYRYAMLFLSPLFILGGVYFLGLFKKIMRRPPVKHRLVFSDFRLFMMTIFLVVFFFFRTGFVNTVTCDSPYSHSLDFDRMKTSGSLYHVCVLEQDVSSARWLSLQIANKSLVYADYGLGIITLIDYTTLNRQNIDYIANETQPSGCYIYLRSFNVIGGIVVTKLGYFNLSDLSSPLFQNCRIYSNGASDVYFTP